MVIENAKRVSLTSTDKLVKKKWKGTVSSSKGCGKETYKTKKSCKGTSKTKSAKKPGMDIISINSSYVFYGNSLVDVLELMLMHAHDWHMPPYQSAAKHCMALDTYLFVPILPFSLLLPLKCHC